MICSVSASEGERRESLVFVTSFRYLYDFFVICSDNVSEVERRESLVFVTSFRYLYGFGYFIFKKNKGMIRQNPLYLYNSPMSVFKNYE